MHWETIENFNPDGSVFKNDDIRFVAEVYGDRISEFLDTKNITATFFPESETYADEVMPSENTSIEVEGLNISFMQDFSFEQSQVLGDLNYCKVNGMRFVKIVTPFTRSRSYDFIITRHDEAKEIIQSLIHNKNNSYIKRTPPHIIGIPIDAIEKKTIDFLLDDNLREFCKKRDIPLKRGVIFEGAPGNGKSMTLKYLRAKADNHNIEFEVFNDIKEFTDNADDYFRDEKKIFVFEDFDTALLDRDNTGGTPNQILGKILNILDGVREIDNVVSIFTTNKINLFDDAFIRPGRIDTVFTFSLPSDDNIKEFIDKYLFDFDKDYVMKVIFDIKPTTNISFAYLKGIADDLNIYNFFQGKMPEKKDIEKIIRERSVQTNKGTDKDVSSYIL
jgi:hypothetical protein